MIVTYLVAGTYFSLSHIFFGMKIFFWMSISSTAQGMGFFNGPFKTVEELMVCVQSRELGARASPSEVYPAGKLQ